MYVQTGLPIQNKMFPCRNGFMSETRVQYEMFLVHTTSRKTVTVFVK